MDQDLMINPNKAEDLWQMSQELHQKGVKIGDNGAL